MIVIIMEGSEKGFFVYRVIVIDCDYDLQNRNLIYSINGIDKGKYNIIYNRYRLLKDILLNKF